MFCFYYQSYVMILLQPPVLVVFLCEELLLSPPGQHPITQVLHSISRVKCLINP